MQQHKPRPHGRASPQCSALAAALPATLAAVLAAVLALALWGQVAAADAARPAATPAAAPSAASGAEPSGVPSPVAPFQASYSWSWHGLQVAISNVALEHREDDTWVYSSSAKPRGLGRLYPMRPNLQSVMRITPEGVRPLSFKATGSGAAHDANVQFDWSAARATGEYEGEKIDMPIKPGVQDDLSVQIAMLDQLRQGSTPDMAFEINKDEVREYDYARDGEQTLATALGSIQTVVYVAHHPGSPRTTSFWCAPSLGFIPMQVQQKRLDTVEWTMTIRSFHRD